MKQNSDKEPVLNLTRHGKHVIWAEINRPKVKNAVNFALMEALENAVDQAEQNEEIRVFVLSGAGQQDFISGGDLKEFHSVNDEHEADAMSARMGKLLARIESADFWTIACINGDAYGGGCETMLAFDFRFAARHVRFGFTQAAFHLTPGWGGLTRLVEKTGRSTALYWLGSMALVETDEALNTGLIDEIFVSDTLREDTLNAAEKLAKNGRELIRTLKIGADFAVRENRTASIEAERKRFTKLWVHPEHNQRVERFLKRKKP